MSSSPEAPKSTDSRSSVTVDRRELHEMVMDYVAHRVESKRRSGYYSFSHRNRFFDMTDDDLESSFDKAAARLYALFDIS